MEERGGLLPRRRDVRGLRRRRVRRPRRARRADRPRREPRRDVRLADAALPDHRTATTATTSPTTSASTPRLGDLGDVVEAIRHAHDRGLRVLMDLVVNHTSNGHPWFEAARRGPRVARSATTTCGPTTLRARRARPQENWTWDDAAGQYYQHQFAPFQPDLNIANPAVRHEIAKTVGFWLDARRLRLPDGRRAVPRAGHRGHRRGPGRGQALAALAARVRDAPPRRGDADGRVQRRQGGGASRSSRITATRCTSSSRS